MRMLLEIACFNISSAIAAAQAGADRIELCDNPQEGGTTPSYGMIKSVLGIVSIPVFPIIRPRGGDFLYTENELASMLYDIQLCRELGCKGIVLGLLTKNGSVDRTRTTQLVQAAGQMEVTFHRAFDRAVNPLQAFEDVIATGCKRLLTSGQQETAMEGKALIHQLVRQSAERIIVMPGSGVRSSNLSHLSTYTGAVEFHSSARIRAASDMQYLSPNFQEDMDRIVVDTNEIQSMKNQLAK